MIPIIRADNTVGELPEGLSRIWREPKFAPVKMMNLEQPTDASRLVQMNEYELRRFYFGVGPFRVEVEVYVPSKLKESEALAAIEFFAPFIWSYAKRRKE